MTIGSKVKVKEPFGFTFTEIYIIIAVQNNVYFLEGIDGGFDASY